MGTSPLKRKGRTVSNGGAVLEVTKLICLHEAGRDVIFGLKQELVLIERVDMVGQADLMEGPIFRRVEILEGASKNQCRKYRLKLKKFGALVSSPLAR